MKLRHVVSFSHVYRMPCAHSREVDDPLLAHFSHFSLTTEMKLLTFMILSHKCSIVVVKVLNTLIRQFVKSRKLSDFCSKTYEKSRNLSAAT